LPPTRLHRYETDEEKAQLLPVLRDISRQEYLKKREDAKLVRQRHIRAGI
jgi:hypothetical protein